MGEGGARTHEGGTALCAVRREFVSLMQDDRVI